MKNLNLKPLFSLLLVAASFFAYSQNNNDIAFTETAVPEKSHLGKSSTIAPTNLDDVLKELTNYLNANVKAPEILGFYNADAVVLASFSLTEKGEIKNISISKKSDKALGEVVMRELGKLAKITPVQENGVAVSKYISVPVVFEVD